MRLVWLVVSTLVERDLDSAVVSSISFRGINGEKYRTTTGGSYKASRFGMSQFVSDALYKCHKGVELEALRSTA